jgi:hypothetical protein
MNNISPYAVQNDLLAQATGNEIDIVDPTTPIGMLLEASSNILANNVNEMQLQHKMMFPSMSTSVEDLLHHFTDDEEIHLFASASKTLMSFYINVNDTKSYGVHTVSKDGNTDLWKVTLPKNTKVTVGEMPFTVMDDVDITITKYVNHTTSFALYTNNSETYQLEDKGLGVLPSTIIQNKDGVEWVKVEIPVYQLLPEQYKTTVVRDDAFSITVDTKDQYAFSIITYNKDGEVTKLPKVYSASIFDPTTPQIFVEPMKNKVRYSIPKPYLMNNLVTGDITITTYTTRGKTFLPLYDYKTEDFSVEIAKITTTPEAGAMKSIDVVVRSSNIVDGGVDVRKFQDIRFKVINKTKGIINTPVTFNQLNELARLDGFNISLASDVITKRLYIANKHISISGTSTPTTLDILVGTTTLDLFSVDNPLIKVHNGGIYLRKNTVFEYSGKTLKPVHKSRLDEINSLTPNNKLEYIKDKKWYFSLFDIAITQSRDLTSPRVYDFTRPELTDLEISKRNIYLIQTVNIVGYSIFQYAHGYEIYFELSGNDSFKALETPGGKIGIQLAFDIPNSVKKMTLHSTEYVVPATDTRFSGKAGVRLYKLVVDTDYFTKDGLLITKNLLSPSNSNEVMLNNRAEIIVYSKDVSINTSADAHGFLDEGDIYTGVTTDVIGLIKEKIKVVFGVELTHIWTNSSAVYNERKYKRSLIDIPMTYTEDVYEDFGGCRYKVVDTDGDGMCDEIIENKLHSAGDPILDNEGNQIYKVRKGDVLKDHSGNPIIDGENGLIRYVDAFMMDYKLLLTNNEVYKKTIDLALRTIYNISELQLKTIEETTLERTSLLFKPNKALTNVELTSGTEVYNIVKPVVTYYYEPGTPIPEMEQEVLVTNIGKVLNRYFSKSKLVLRDLRKELLTLVDGVPLAVKVTNLPVDDEVLNIKNNNRFIIDTRLNTKYDIVYNIEVRMINV